MPLNIQTAEDLLCEEAGRFHSMSKLPEAEALYRRVLERRPNHAQALFGLGTIAHQCGKNHDAVRMLTHAAQIAPSSSLYNNLGEAYRALGRGDDAMAAFRKAIDIKPTDPMPYNNLGIVLCLLGRLREAEESWRKAIDMLPNYTDALNNLGNAMLDQGEPEEALRIHRRTLEILPEFARAHSNMLRDMNHIAPFDLDAIRKEHAAWWPQQAGGIKALTTWANTRDPNRPIKVGLMSPDFREHSVSYFLEPWLAGRDRNRVKVFCYAELAMPDKTTERLFSYTEGSRSTIGIADDVVARSIVADGIDILIDLAGHTASNRLRVLAFRPAPVQVSLLGYPFTTGSPHVDWKITDAVADPPGMTERAYTEKLWRLPKTAWCYRPFARAGEVSPPPCAANGHITFGSFNSFAKVSSELVAAWSKILTRVPGSKLLLKSNALGDEGVRQRTLERFAKHGIQQDRLILKGRLRDTAEHIALYSQVDIALDTFPYNGTTTTCEAMWMGVPVIGREGVMHVERVGSSLLHTVGLAELLAPTIEGYIDLAVKLANDPARIAELRRGMRDRMQSSPLMDEAGYARDFDEALHGMFRAWCGAG